MRKEKKICKTIISAVLVILVLVTTTVATNMSNDTIGVTNNVTNGVSVTVAESDKPAITPLPTTTPNLSNTPLPRNTVIPASSVLYAIKYTNPQSGISVFGKSFENRFYSIDGAWLTPWFEFYLPAASYVYIDVNGRIETKNSAYYVSYVDGQWGEEQYMSNSGNCNPDVFCNIEVQRGKWYYLSKGLHNQMLFGWVGGLPNYESETGKYYGKFYGDISILAIPEFTAITILSPNGGETWYRGQTKTITWKSDGKPGNNVIIDIYKGSSRILQISSMTANDGSYTWLIPSLLQTGTDYKIKITSYEDSKYYDWSDNNFRIY